MRGAEARRYATSADAGARALTVRAARGIAARRERARNSARDARGAWRAVLRSRDVFWRALPQRCSETRRCKKNAMQPERTHQMRADAAIRHDEASHYALFRHVADVCC